MGPDHSILSVPSLSLNSSDALPAIGSSADAALATTSATAVIATATARAARLARVESRIMYLARQLRNGLSHAIANWRARMSGCGWHAPESAPEQTSPMWRAEDIHVHSACWLCAAAITQALGTRA